jgi:hypothetical protein
MLQRPNPLANRRRQAAANKIFVSLPAIPPQAKCVEAILMTGIAGDILPMEDTRHFDSQLAMSTLIDSESMASQRAHRGSWNKPA